MYRICRHPYYLSNFIVDAEPVPVESEHLPGARPYPSLFWGRSGNLAGRSILLGESFLSAAQYDFLFRYRRSFPVRDRLFAGQALKETSLSRITMNECSRIIKFWGFALVLILIHVLAVADRGMGCAT